MSNRGLFILGMHRSGTSLAAGLARLAGVDLGHNLLVGRSAENPRGFWEHRDVLRIDEAILTGLSLYWAVPAPLPDDWLEQPQVTAYREQAEAILRREFTTASVWGIKDPRLCRLWPFWERAAAGLADEFATIHVFRHPLDVAASLAARNAMPLKQAVALWLFHVLEASGHHRGRTVVHLPIEQLASDPLAAAKTIRTLMGRTDPLPPAAERRIERFVDPTLLNRRPSETAPDTPLVRLAVECHATLHQLAEAGTAAGSHAPLSAIHQQLLDIVAQRRASQRPPRTIDVVVPVYRDRAATLAAIDSVRAGGGDFELVVINDASPDAGLTADLRARADRSEFTLLTNPENCGFVASANRGLQLHPDRDVVLLNSDTVVPPGWLDRLARAARADLVGTVTPFSNNATIASYPVPLEANPLPEGWTVAELDSVFRDANAGWQIDMPTAVGFCMYIRRDCLTDVGLFDEDRFGRGYGEENDFSLRASARGWRNVLAADLFVFHHGRASFGDEAEARGVQATATIERLHPTYAAAVQRFLTEDPLAAARERVDVGRVERRGSAECRRVLAARRMHEERRLREARERIDALLTNVADLDRALARAEEIAGERLTETSRLDRALARAESIAAERLLEIKRLDDALGTVEPLAAQRLAEIERLDKAQGTAEAIASERLEQLAARDAQLRATETALAATETLAVERLTALESLDCQLRETSAALASVEDLARGRLAQIEDLTRQVEVFTAGLQQPPGRRPG